MSDNFWALGGCESVPEVEGNPVHGNSRAPAGESVFAAEDETDQDVILGLCCEPPHILTRFLRLRDPHVQHTLPSRRRDVKTSIQLHVHGDLQHDKKT